jgi:ankyrin repeat protein
MFKPLLAIFALALPLAAAEPPPVEDLLRQGLYQEEANRDFDKAAENYRAVIAQHDRQRSLAATATYRLGEIARKKGDQAAAAEAFLTVVTRFPEQEDLVRLSRENLTALGTAVPAPPAAPGTAPVAADPAVAEIDRLKQLARSSPDLLDGADNDGWRPLHLAAAKGQVKVIAYLLENRADPNGRTNKEQLTPLQLASAHGHLEAVRTLLAAKAELNATVEFAVARASLPTLDNRAAGAGNRPTATFNQVTNPASALDLAILFDRREVARALLATGADFKEPRLQFVLNFTSGKRIGSGPPPSIPGNPGYKSNTEQLADGTILRGPQIPGNPRSQSNSIEIPPVIAPAGYQLPPLLAAICLQRDALVAELLKAGAPLTLTSPEAAPDALMLAAAFHPALVPALLKAGADSKAAMPDSGVTALHLAAEAGFTEVARQLLDAGADPNAPDSAKRTPLHFANGAELVELLGAKGADPNAKDMAGLTPLDYAAVRGRESAPATLASLFKGGAEPEDPLALLDRADPGCSAALLQPLLRDRLYPKQARDDAVLLAIRLSSQYSKSQTAVGPLEVRPVPGSPAPSLGEALKFTQGNIVVSAVTILRRGAGGRFEPVFGWEWKPGESKGPAWPPLEWGDVVELRLAESQRSEGLAPYSLFQPTGAPTVTVRFAGMEFHRKLIAPDAAWLGSEEAKQLAVKWSPWARDDGGRGNRQPRPRVVVPTPAASGAPRFSVPENPYPVDSFGVVPSFADPTRITVIRQGGAQPFAVDLTNKGAVPLRLVDGDVIELVMSDAARNYLDQQKCALLYSGDFSVGGLIEQSLFEGWPYALGRTDTTSKFAIRADWSKVTLHRGGVDGKVETLDLAKRMASLPPRDQWTRPLVSEALPKLNSGDLLVIPPLPENADEAACQLAATTFEMLLQTSNWLVGNR